MSKSDNQHDTDRLILKDINWHGRPGSVGPYQQQVEDFMAGRITITEAQLSKAMREACPESWGEGQDETLWKHLLSEGTLDGR